MGVYQKVKGKNEPWWIDYRFKGKRYRQLIGTKKKEAEEALAQIKIKISAGDFVPIEERQEEESSEPQSPPLKDFVKDDLLPWSEVQHSANHHRRLRYALDIHLLPFFGECHLHEITPKQIEDYKGKRHREGYRRGKKKIRVSEATINRELCCLKLIFRKAVEWDKITESPARNIKTFKETPNPPRLLDEEEISRLLDEVPERLKALVACAVYAGLRKTELFQLQWKDIDFRTGELTVVSREGKRTKNNESRRIPMNDALAEALQRHRHLKGPYVFCSSDGKPQRDVRTALNNAADRAKIEGPIKLHQLRHAFCSHALMQGIDPRTVQKWMGHKDLTTTLRYAHVSPDHERSAIQKLQFKKWTPMVTRGENGQ